MLLDQGVGQLPGHDPPDLGLLLGILVVLVDLMLKGFLFRGGDTMRYARPGGSITPFATR